MVYNRISSLKDFYIDSRKSTQDETLALMMLLGILLFAFGWCFVSFQVWFHEHVCRFLLYCFWSMLKKQKRSYKNPEFSQFSKLFLISWFVIQHCYCGRPNSYPRVVSMHKKLPKVENILTWSVVPLCGSNATGTSENIKVNNAASLVL